MTAATILILTHRHAKLLPYAVRSALAQEGVEIEVFVVGNGVEDDTRRALAPFLLDPRLRFFDCPKGERHGERLRHEALQESTAPIVCYLSDDDLLLPGHVAQIQELLKGADFAQDIASKRLARRQPSLQRVRPRATRVRRAPGRRPRRRRADRSGWRPAPPSVPTDVYMWQQFLTIPGFRGVTGDRLTSLVFPSPLRTHMTAATRAAELERWQQRIVDPEFPTDLETLAAVAARRAAERLKLTALRLERELDRVQRTRWWRARRGLAELRPVRALRARRREGR